MTYEIFKTIKNIEMEEYSYKIKIEFDDGSSITQYHEQDCCEDVYVSQVDGDIKRFIEAEAFIIDEKTENCTTCDESGTWTFYTLNTSKGYLDWRWQGESNGYYSESVTMKFNGDFKQF